MKMRIKMAVENDIPDGFCQTSGTVENIQGIAFLGSMCDGVQDGGNRIFSFQAPLVIVEMENVGFFYSAVNQPDF